MRRGRSVWAAAAKATDAQVAREWMGWSPPARCGEVAKSLAVRSAVLGQALNANQDTVAPTSALAAAPEPEPAAPEPVMAPAPEPAVAEAPAPKPTPVAVAKPAPKPVLKPAVAATPKPPAKPAAPKVAAGPAPSLPIGAFVIDPDNPRGCPGKIDATIKAGRIVMVCMP
jgi:outer membrane biosynthesis protein TonB